MGYQQANTDFYGSTMGMEILCLAVFTPMLEELVFRGFFWKIKRYAVETVCGWNFGTDFCSRACQYRAVHLRTDSRCGAGTSDGSCGKCLCIHDRTYDGKFYCSCADGNALAGFQRQGDAVSWIFSLVVLGAGIVLMWRYLSDRKSRKIRRKNKIEVI